ncbi:MAG: metalloprotease [Tissierellia bacterium]|nr:metalloprotease [Tissierellia bacterium]
MKWQGRRQSSNVEDRRGQRGPSGGGKGMIGGGLGLVIVIIIMLLGGNPGDLINSVPSGGADVPYVETAQDKELAEFISVVLADTEDVWTEVLGEEGIRYVEPTLVLFSGSVESACGVAGSSTGPFYCPADQKVYIDLSFFDELRDKFQAPGDFAMAYVLAHEVGHHVQKLLGVSDQVQELRGQLSEVEYNQYLMRLELQADYLAGVFAHHAQGRGYLEEGDLEEALNAASAVGDDRIQKQTQGYVVPDSFTHGTSEQRQRWFYKGYKAGNLSQWNTFEVKDL